MRVIWLTGDYTGERRERQRQAAEKNCDIVIEFHFNSAANKTARGAEVWYRMYSIYSRRLAEILLDKMCELGLKRRGIYAATKDSRAAFINSYPNTAFVVLLEPAFVSNIFDAKRLHNKEFMEKLAKAIVDGLKAFADELKHRTIEVVGLSIGHVGKMSNPYDKGALCVFGDYESDHARELARLVYSCLKQYGCHSEKGGEV